MKCAWVFLACIGLIGCAPLSPPSVADGSMVEVDTAKMATVERAARTGGVTVYWINAPRKAAAHGS
jgi:starvation-inducible outer membrane lipoprotein